MCRGQWIGGAYRFLHSEQTVEHLWLSVLRRHYPMKRCNKIVMGQHYWEVRIHPQTLLIKCCSRTWDQRHFVSTLSWTRDIITGQDAPPGGKGPTAICSAAQTVLVMFLCAAQVSTYYFTGVPWGSDISVHPKEGWLYIIPRRGALPFASRKCFGAAGGQNGGRLDPPCAPLVIMFGSASFFLFHHQCTSASDSQRIQISRQCKLFY